MITITRLPKGEKQGIDITEYEIHGSQVNSDGSPEMDGLARALHQFLEMTVMDDSGALAPAFIHFQDETRFLFYSTFPLVNAARAKRILQCVRRDWMSWSDRPFYYITEAGPNDYRVLFITMAGVEGIRDIDYDFDVLCRTIGEPWDVIVNMEKERRAVNE